MDQPGPPLTVGEHQLAAALTCSPTVGHSAAEPVLLVPGTGMTFQAFYAWNWANELTRLGIPWCGVSPPYRQLGDTQVAGEYDVYAIRTLYHRSGNRKIAIIGHSQGGMQPRWALRFWPDTRAMVADDIGIAPDNQGTANGRTIVDSCSPLGECPLNFWQAATGSHFIAALNSGRQMFDGIDYTVIYSTSDSVVLPGDTPLSGPGSYRRIALQSICPADVSTHFQDGSTDPVGFALALDAITHPGPANPSRIPASVCAEGLIPGLTPAAATIGAVQAGASVIEAAAGAPLSRAEPPLACYVTASCTAATAPTLKLSKLATHRPHGMIAVRMLVTADEGGAPVPVPGATVVIGRRVAVTGALGIATVVLRAGSAGRYRVAATLPGCNSARRVVTVGGPVASRGGSDHKHRPSDYRMS
ncbi:MAG: lipase family alpha/beta hydrolase [Solirubrobacteraceae bacterium]